MNNLYQEWNHNITQESKSHFPNHAKPISTDLLSPLGVTYNKEQNLTNGGEDGTLGGEKVKVGHSKPRYFCKKRDDIYSP